jgi:hypothetical protein
MIFLIEYSRPQGRIVTLRKFADSERAKAQDERLDIELALNPNDAAQHEVVLLEASDETALRRTHQRYFHDLSQIIKSANGGQ